MRVADVMTRDVVTIGADASVREVAALLSKHGISGVPVVDGDKHVIGIVSEGDLLHRAEIGTERPQMRRRSWWLGSLASGAAPDYVMSHGRHVADVMTREVISVSETSELGDVATLLETRGIKRVPVVNDGVLVGIISRANLVRSLAAAEPSASNDAADEHAIRSRVLDELIRKRLFDELVGMQWTNVWADDVIVKDQVVHLWICNDRPAGERQALRIAAENTAGVRGVQEHIIPAPPILSF